MKFLEFSNKILEANKKIFILEEIKKNITEEVYSLLNIIIFYFSKESENETGNCFLK